MARCLRCGAGNEWIEGDVKKEPAHYWKKRCEAAERNIETYSTWSEMTFENDGEEAQKEAYDKFQQANNQWQQLKNNPTDKEGEELLNQGKKQRID